MTEKPTKPAKKRATQAKPKPPVPDQSEVAERAYFIHLEDGGSDELARSLDRVRQDTPGIQAVGPTA
jgi:hypothetical protein